MEPSTPAPARRVLLVGINDYTAAARQRPADSPAYPVPGDLAGPRNDVAAVAEVLTARFGFAPSDIRSLLDGEATRQGILDAIEQHLVAPCQPGDEVVFYFSGHGTRVRNSLSESPDRFDEALVPADVALGVPSLRSKELRRIFHRVLDRGGRLTSICDSCFSGAVVRGATVRFTAGGNEDVRDGSDAGLPLLTRGALILGASKDFEVALEKPDERGVVRGQFTRALLEALGRVALDSPAEAVFRYAASLLTVSALGQSPELQANEDRRSSPIFQTDLRHKGRSLGGSSLVVHDVDVDGTVLLVGGWATGLFEGAELEVKVPSGADERVIRLRVTEVRGPVRARAELVDERLDGSRVDALAVLSPGQIATVTAWTHRKEPALRLFWTESDLEATDLEQLARRVRASWTSVGGQWIADPLMQGADFVIRWNGTAWVQSSASGEVQLGSQFGATGAVEQPAGGGVGGPGSLFLDLPLARSIARDLELGEGRRNDAVSREDYAESAHYRLQGRFEGEVSSFRWVRTRADAVTSLSEATLPLCTGWRFVRDPLLAGFLQREALKLAKIRAYLTLPAPAYSDFPFRLVLRERGTRRSVRRDLPVEERTGRPGSEYSLILERLGDQQAPVEPHYVYVFSIDCDGRSTLVFPDPELGNAKNCVPMNTGEPGHERSDIELGEGPLFQFREPFGWDTFFLLASRVALPNPADLQFRSVRSSTGGNREGVDGLIAEWTATQGKAVQVTRTSPTWMLERIEVRSVAPTSRGDSVVALRPARKRLPW
jgi:Caspase domain